MFSPLSAVFGDFGFGCNAEIVAERVSDIGRDSGNFPIGQAVERRHVGAAPDDLNRNLSDRQMRKGPTKSRCGVVALPLAFAIATMTSGTTASVDAPALGRQLVH